MHTTDTIKNHTIKIKNNKHSTTHTIHTKYKHTQTTLEQLITLNIRNIVYIQNTNKNIREIIEHTKHRIHTKHTINTKHTTILYIRSKQHTKHILEILKNTNIIK